VAKPLIYSWQSGPKGQPFVVANVFFGGQYCLLQQRYLEPQVLSTHTNLGSGESKLCSRTTIGSFIRWLKITQLLGDIVVPTIFLHLGRVTKYSEF
jgi:hypothetical protein